MWRIGLGLLAIAAAASFSLAAAAQSEMETFQQTGDALLSQHREALQRNIDEATKALQAKDFKAARRYAAAVTRADPKRVQAWLLLGAAQLGVEDFKAARGTYATAVRLSPVDPEARAGLGVALARTNDPKAQAQLAWLNEKIQACGACYQAGQLARFKSDVERAITLAATSIKRPG